MIMVNLPSVSSSIHLFDIGRMTLKYFNVIKKAEETKTLTLQISRHISAPFQQYPPELDKQYNRILAADAMEKASKAGEAGEFEKGRIHIKNVCQLIQDSVSGDDPFCKGLVADLLKCEQALMDKESYVQKGNMLFINNLNAHFMQRSSNVHFESQAFYQTSSRLVMQDKFKEDKK
eukprot:TRINITY_DN2657_c0_g2_i4.p1 TRINITY_DN2657_c0_g2~~TRINITY_DN2657_c0_g2_i4.p1  ORF type:complete len:176 (-),score=61.78 TRINITY_DN2657_c0_g2_i4:3-530(-)